jgi:hypothetical protein
MTTHAIVTREPWLAAAALAAADWLALAATPAFAVMALFAAMDAPHDVLCSIASRPMNGMVWMYALMSTSHAGPWLKLYSKRLETRTKE